MELPETGKLFQRPTAEGCGVGEAASETMGLLPKEFRGVEVGQLGRRRGPKTARLGLIGREYAQSHRERIKTLGRLEGL